MALTVSDSARDRARSLRMPDIPKKPSIISKLFRPDPELARKRKERREEYRLERRRLARAKFSRDKKIFSQTRGYQSKMEQKVRKYKGKPYAHLPPDVGGLLHKANVKAQQWNDGSEAAHKKIRDHFRISRREELRKSEKQFTLDERALLKNLDAKYSSKKAGRDVSNLRNLAA